MIGQIWNGLIIQPMINTLLLLYGIFFSNFAIAIAIFTVLVRCLMMPLTVKQSRQMKAMSALQPRVKEIQAKYDKDRQRQSQETMKLYKEQGVSPIGCLGPMFIQFPIWIGLYQAIMKTVPSAPESLVSLSKYLYPWLPMVQEVIPLNSTFYWLELAEPDPMFVLPVLVGASMWLMQKMTTMPAMDARQESTNRMMLWMMPLMFGFFTMQFPSGLALYWIISNAAGIVIQGFITGWEPLRSIAFFRRNRNNDTVSELVPVSTVEEVVSDANDRNDSQGARGRDRNRTKGARRRPRRGRNRRH